MKSQDGQAVNFLKTTEMKLIFICHSQFIEITKSFYEYFISQNTEARVLDLGCGDGLFIQELLKSFTPAKVTLVDGSNEMLEAAKERLGSQANLNFTQASFQELLTNDPLNENFDFIYSSLAIHHLPFDEKIKFYAYIHKRLSPCGHFERKWGQV